MWPRAGATLTVSSRRTAERSEWDSLTLDEHRLDHEQRRRLWEEANARYEADRRRSDG